MKALLFIILILILGGCIFFFGWIQISVPSNSYTVVFTKTSGFDQTVVKPGSFTWRWEKLIPKNTSLFVFQFLPYQTVVEATGVLPSGTLYASFVPESPDFSFAVKYSITLQFVPEKLPHLVETYGVTAENIGVWYQREADSLAQQATEQISNLEEPAILYNVKRISQHLVNSLSDDENMVEIIDIRPIQVQLPDLDLYYLAKETYFAINTAQKETRIAAIRQLEVQRERERQTLSVLEEYGRLLSEYPVLVDFINMMQTSGQGVGIGELKLPDVLHPSD